MTGKTPETPPVHFTSRREPIPKTVVVWGRRGDKLRHVDPEAERPGK